MYIGAHGLTVIELPDGETVYSRDLFLEVAPQRVVEIVSVGKFFVISRNTKFNREDSFPENETGGI